MTFLPEKSLVRSPLSSRLPPRRRSCVKSPPFPESAKRLSPRSLLFRKASITLNKKNSIGRCEHARSRNARYVRGSEPPSHAVGSEADESGQSKRRAFGPRHRMERRSIQCPDPPSPGSQAGLELHVFPLVFVSLQESTSLMGAGHVEIDSLLVPRGARLDALCRHPRRW